MSDKPEILATHYPVRKMRGVAWMLSRLPRTPYTYRIESTTGQGILDLKLGGDYVSLAVLLAECRARMRADGALSSRHEAELAAALKARGLEP